MLGEGAWQGDGIVWRRDVTSQWRVETVDCTLMRGPDVEPQCGLLEALQTPWHCLGLWRRIGLLEGFFSEPPHKVSSPPAAR